MKDNRAPHDDEAPGPASPSPAPGLAQGVETRDADALDLGNPEDMSGDNVGADGQVPEGSRAERRRRVHRPALMWLVFIVAVSVLVLDQVVKTIVLHVLTPGQPIDVLGSFVQLDLVKNPGAAFSIAVNYTWVLSIIATVVIIIIIYFSSRLGSAWWALAFGLLLGGAMGNLWDRFFRAPGFAHGYVIDFISVQHFAVFNIADSAITCAAVLIIVLGLRGIGIDGRVVSDEKKSRTSKKS